MNTKQAYDRVLKAFDKAAAGYVHVKITGWGGVRKIPVKQLRAFAKDLKAISAVSGFEINNQTVQIRKKAVPQLEALVKKHKLKSGAPQKATTGIVGIDTP
jgi:hypothetical protein